MTEAELQTQIIAAARDLGWKAVQGDGVGWPDLTLCRTRQLILAELKSVKEKPSAAQQAWLDVLATVPGVRTFVWRPADWEDGSIVRELVRPYSVNITMLARGSQQPVEWPKW